MPKYLLYATMDGYPTGSIAVVDCETDSIINYIRNLTGSPGVIASPDGRYLAVIGSGPPYIFDAVTLSPIKPLSTSGYPLFLPDAGIVLCAGRDSTTVYSLPDFIARETWQRHLDQPTPVPGRQQVALVGRALDGNRSKLLFYNYLSTQAVDSIVMEPRPQSAGSGFQIFDFAFSLSGERLYALGWVDRENFFIGYDLETRQTLFLQPIYASLGSCKVTPDGREVWVTEFDPSYGDLPSWPQAISIFDAITGTLVDTVSTFGIDPNPYKALAPREIRILPDGSKTYVSCGDIFKGTQPVLVINTTTRRIERLIFGDFKTPAWWIDVAPRP
jgi:DNA-binding beta-propeller fold protein YncE